MKFRYFLLALVCSAALASAAEVVDASSLRGKVLCGYQGWFRCPGDAQNGGWIHWSRNGKRIAPDTLTFEMWPDLAEFPEKERYLAPGFTDAAGQPMHLFSSDDAATVRRHFDWMRTAGIDGVWLQHFVVDLVGGPLESRQVSRRRVLEHVRTAARETGRAWALTYDISGTPTERIYDGIVRDWQKLVDEGVTRDPQYVREGGEPVVEIFGFNPENHGHAFPPELANRLIDYFQAAGPYQAFLVGSGAWHWRRNSDPAWQAIYWRLDGYAPWNPGNYYKDRAGDFHATTNYWAEDKAECEKHGVLWLPVVYPGFSWDNLQKKAPGTTNVARHGGKFLWEQFHAASKLGADSIFVAMFDEVDEGTAIFKVTNTPPVQGHFVTYEGLPSNWYLRLTGEATRLLRAKQPIPAEIPIQP